MAKARSVRGNGPRAPRQPAQLAQADTIQISITISYKDYLELLSLSEVEKRSLSGQASLIIASYLREHRVDVGQASLFGGEND